MSSLILASTSPYRQELLGRLCLEFSIVAPGIDETPLAGENPSATAERLALAKARSVAEQHPRATVIGSDQVAHLGSTIFGKPGTRERAKAQLLTMSGKEITFHSGLCVFDAKSSTYDLIGIENRVAFRELSEAEIDRYLDKEDALNCAGSAKSEGLGITLIRHIRGDDPNALIGLPLIALSELLRKRGFVLP